MAIGLLGKKLGMSHVYDQNGRRVAVTVIQAGPCTVLGVREQEKDGYSAVQVGFEAVKESKLTRPMAGQFKKSGTGPFRFIREFRLADLTRGPQLDKPEQSEDAKSDEKKSENSGRDEGQKWTVGQELTVGIFQVYELVDVSGISIGKGFQGGIKRWGWSGGPESHGSTSHRAPGSIGASAFPSRVLKGHHLPGHMGSDRVTVQNVRIVECDAEKNLLMVEGAVPGPENATVVIQKSKKRSGVVKAPQAVQEVGDDEEFGGKKSKGAAKAKRAAK